MPRKESNQLSVYCRKCKDYTQSTNPVTIRRSSDNFYDIYITCSICNTEKYKRLNPAQKKLLPKDILDLPIKSEVFDDGTKEGGIFPLIPLIGAIAAGVSALAGAGGAVAGAVQRGQANSEQARHNRALEDIARGKGFESNLVPKQEMIERCIAFLRENGIDVLF